MKLNSEEKKIMRWVYKGRHIPLMKYVFNSEKFNKALTKLVAYKLVIVEHPKEDTAPLEDLELRSNQTVKGLWFMFRNKSLMRVQRNYLVMI